MQNLKVKLKEGLKFGGNIYDYFSFEKGGKNILVSKEGILGHDNQLITWSDIEALKKIYDKKDIAEG